MVQSKAKHEVRGVNAASSWMDEATHSEKFSPGCQELVTEKTVSGEIRKKMTEEDHNSQSCVCWQRHKFGPYSDFNIASMLTSVQ